MQLATVCCPSVTVSLYNLSALFRTDFSKADLRWSLHQISVVYTTESNNITDTLSHLPVDLPDDLAVHYHTE